MLSPSTGGTTARHSATVCFVTRIGRVEVEAGAEGVTRVRLAVASKPREVGSGPALEVAERARQEILDFLAGKLQSFTVTVVVAGTKFQMAVWEEIRKIPFGGRRTYRELARALNRPAAARAVGAACGANPVPLIVPCHRVVGSDGSLGGFGGGVEMKASLLELESAKVGGQLALDFG